MAGRAARVSISPVTSSSSARWAAVDHSAGRRLPASPLGVSRTDQIGAQEPAGQLGDLRHGQPAAREGAEVLDHVGLGEPGDRAHNPLRVHQRRR